MTFYDICSAVVLNNLVAVEIKQWESVQIVCRLLTGFEGEAYCEISYGTDPSRVDLPFTDTSESVGTGGDSIAITLSTPLEPNTTYFYNVSTNGGSVDARVVGTFRTGICDFNNYY